MRRGWVKVPAAAASCARVVGALQGRVVAAGVERDFEAGGRDGPRVRGARDDAWLVVRGFSRVGLGQVGERDLVADAGACWFQSVKAA